ncbi:dihydroorotate dehydrogenase [Psilocybe cubensis]|uniref:Orotidine 5'-phosphate decarboxylase n=2 Tax=Psilocybe cubensis TaxID=181762 RepID=A0A8H8CK01_PSICU|nr:dihydroorotate dehydrogenase [Psilocybe cubensis]KAH9482744.1 dihydroorotate dehydrogenase [Psilocybe cubensis]
MSFSSAYKKTYGNRVSNFSNPTAKLILETMERKKSNLAVSVDVTDANDLLAIIEAVAPYHSHELFFKTHIDIIQNFDFSLIEKLQHLSQKYDFVYFEDRKFADIGNTVALQYSSGVYKIASWSHLTNAHPVPGLSIIKGLSSVGLPLGRGLLLLAEMSTKGSLAVGTYTEEAVRMARQNRDFVIGFIAQKRMDGVGSSEEEDTSDEDFLILTPGIGLDAKGDSMGQQYRTPREAIFGSGCDIIIVGRGIYGTDSKAVDTIAAQAERYMAEGWAAYLARINNE